MERLSNTSQISDETFAIPFWEKNKSLIVCQGQKARMAGSNSSLFIKEEDKSSSVLLELQLFLLSSLKYC